MPRRPPPSANERTSPQASRPRAPAPCPCAHPPCVRPAAPCRACSASRAPPCLPRTCALRPPAGSAHTPGWPPEPRHVLPRTAQPAAAGGQHAASNGGASDAQAVAHFGRADTGESRGKEPMDVDGDGCTDGRARREGAAGCDAAGARGERASEQGGLERGPPASDLRRTPSSASQPVGRNSLVREAASEESPGFRRTASPASSSNYSQMAGAERSVHASSASVDGWASSGGARRGGGGGWATVRQHCPAAAAAAQRVHTDGGLGGSSSTRSGSGSPSKLHAVVVQAVKRNSSGIKVR